MYQAPLWPDPLAAVTFMGFWFGLFVFLCFVWLGCFLGVVCVFLFEAARKLDKHLLQTPSIISSLCVLDHL